MILKFYTANLRFPSSDCGLAVEIAGAIFVRRKKIKNILRFCLPALLLTSQYKSNVAQTKSALSHVSREAKSICFPNRVCLDAARRSFNGCAAGRRISLAGSLCGVARWFDSVVPTLPLVRQSPWAASRFSVQLSLTPIFIGL